jgi:hypothetical protein
MAALLRNFEESVELETSDGYCLVRIGYDELDEIHALLGGE